MLYNERTRKFVLFFHLDSPDFGPVPGSPYSGHVGILTSDKVRDKFSIRSCGKEQLLGRLNQACTWLRRLAPQRRLCLLITESYAATVCALCNPQRAASTRGSSTAPLVTDSVSTENPLQDTLL